MSACESKLASRSSRKATVAKTVFVTCMCCECKLKNKEQGRLGNKVVVTRDHTCLHLFTITSVYLPVESSGSILTTESLQPCQQHPPHQPGPSSPQPKQSRADILQSQYPLDQHTMQAFCFKHNHQTSLLWYASYLKSVYTRRKLPIYDKWPKVKSKKYINLALIEKEDITKPEANQFKRATIHGNIGCIKESKRSMHISQIAQLPDGSQLKCILVEGPAGVGKSTLAWKLCRKWGKGKLLQQYHLVVLLRLRDKSVRAAKNISDLFQYHNHQIQQAAVKEVQDAGGKGVLLVLEGYDELPEELRSGSSVFLDVITERKLPEATVLITSRPWASEFLHRECKEHISQYIEILGFTKDNIQSYLETTIPNDPSLLADLQKYILCYPHIKSLMYIPLNSAIVIEVYRNCRNDKTLVPKTMTELYSSLVRSLLLRHLLDHPLYNKKKWRIHCFNDLPQDVYRQLHELSRTAYEGILHDQQVIFSDLPEDFETLGLMHCTPELYVDEGTAYSYNFLHLTVQEYLAAFYLSQQPVEKQIELLSFHKEHNSKYWCKENFHMVLRFLCGVRKFSGYPINALNTLCIEKTGNDSASIEHEITLNTLHWLFEAQDNDVIANLLGSSDMQLRRQFSKITPFDCFVLGYCVSHSNCTWKIDFTQCYIGTRGVEMLVRGALEELINNCMGWISELNLNGNAVGSEGVKHLLKFPKHLINKLETLDLQGNMLDSESNATLSNLIPHLPHLKILKLSYNYFNKGAVPLTTSLTAHNLLEELSLSFVAIGVEDCRALNKLLSSSTSLNELNVDSNFLTPKAVELIICGLNQNITLKRLDMKNSYFCLQNTILLASVLRTNNTLVYLNIGHCGIDSDGACQLASALCTNDALLKLHLVNSPIGVDGATAFAEMLWTNHTLIDLNLGQCNIDSDGAYQLASALCTNHTLQTLYLNNSPIGVKGTTAFAEMLRANHTLVDLNLGHCNIDSDGACQLASALCTNDTLCKMHLENNPISIKGAVAFAEMLLKNKSLKFLNLRDDSTDEEGTQKLIDALMHNTTVEKLWLSYKYYSSIAGSGLDSRVISFPL